MPTKYRKTVSERKPKEKKRGRYPELRLAAEIAGVSHWTVYKVLDGSTQSQKVKLALEMARGQLRAKKRDELKTARKELRRLKAEQRKLQQVLEKGRAA